LKRGKAASTGRSILGESEFKKGKLEPSTPLAQPPKCPECRSQKVWKDGLRYTKHGDVQRYLCRNCGYRFSEPNVKVNVTTQSLKSLNPRPNLPDGNITRGEFPVKERLDPLSFQRREDVASHTVSVVAKPINTFRVYSRERRVCETDGVLKNLVKVETRLKQATRGATKPTSAEVKGKIVEFAWYMQKQGYAQSTIETYGRILQILLERNVNLFEPEAVKEYLAKQKISEAYKHSIIATYTLFLGRQGLQWQPPKCDVTRKLPFIPTEKEIDDLIAGCGKKTATFLQLLKETAMRCGEANRLEWIDIDFQRRIITLNKPEKKGKPRIFNVSNKLIAMLNALPKTNHRIFPSTVSVRRVTFHYSRKRIAKKLQSPSLLRIGFHTFRHWKATMLYHQTKDILYVKEFLGHRRIDTTLLYIQLAKALFKETTDEFTVKVARKPEEIKALLEVGFEHVCEKDSLLYFRKRK